MYTIGRMVEKTSKPTTTIKVERSVHDKLASLGSKDSSFNSIIKNLLEKAGTST